jgi:putative ABC transport system permease protein
MDILELTVWDVLISLGLVAIIVVVSITYRLTLEKDLAIGAIRCFIQLIAAGYILKWIFGFDKWYVVLLTLVVMTLIAGYHALRRADEPLGRSLVYVIGGIVIGSSIVITVTFGLIIRVDPWYEPQYVIPLGGMIINVAMNGVSVGMHSLKNAIKSNRDYIESALALGIRGDRAARKFYRQAIKTALIPAINGLMTVGIVQFPGMMTGQITAGADPTQAVLYQIVVMYALAAAQCISVIVGLRFYVRSFFNKAQQLVLEE